MGLLTAVLLTTSLHTPSTIDNYNLNSDNFGAGLEYTTEEAPLNLTYGASTYYNEYRNQTAAVSIAKQWKYGGVGLMAATGYEHVATYKLGDDIAVIPVVTLRYEYVRVQTALPLASLDDQYRGVNLQFVYDFK